MEMLWGTGQLGETMSVTPELLSALPSAESLVGTWMLRTGGLLLTLPLAS